MRRPICWCSAWRIQLTAQLTISAGIRLVPVHRQSIWQCEFVGLCLAGEAEAASARATEAEARAEAAQALVQRLEEDLLAAQLASSAGGEAAADGGGGRDHLLAALGRESSGVRNFGLDKGHLEAVDLANVSLQNQRLLNR